MDANRRAQFRFSIRQDLLPNIEASTVRLHGRNAEQWWEHEDRRIATTISILKRLVPLAGSSPRGRSSRDHLLNNHFAAQAVADAVVLRHLLDEPVEEPMPAELVRRYPVLEGRWLFCRLHGCSDDPVLGSKLAHTSMPEITLPKTWCFPSRWLAGPITINNAVSALAGLPACAIDTIPTVCLSVLRTRRRQSDSTTAVPDLLRHVSRLWIAKLHDEIRRHPMHAKAVVEPFVDQTDDMRDRFGRLAWIRLDLEGPFHGLEDEDGAGLRLSPQAQTAPSVTWSILAAHSVAPDAWFLLSSSQSEQGRSRCQFHVVRLEPRLLFTGTRCLL